MVTAFSPGLTVSSNPAYAPGSAPGFDGGGFLPNSLSDGALWLDAAEIATITSSSGSVSQWDDKFPTANNATQGTGAEQPLTDTNTINSRNVITFDGSDDKLDFPHITGLFDGFTAFIVLNSRASTGGDTFGFAISVNGATFGDGSENAPSINFSGGITQLNWQVSDQSVSLTSFAEQPRIMGCTSDGSNITYRTDGAQVTTDSGASSSEGSTASALGGSPTTSINYFKGDVGEIIIYGRLLSTNEISAVELYLSNKWGIALV